MSYLLDTGILLRLANRDDSQHQTVFHAVQILVRDREELLMTTQNSAEFLNVATRPVANNGFGWTLEEAMQLLENDLELVCTGRITSLTKIAK
jgi:predicted nucleic acid-binding protein